MGWLDKLIAWLASYFHWDTELDTLQKSENSPLVPITPQIPTMPTNAEKLVAAAKSCLGQDLSLGTGVDYEVACAISVNKVHQEAFGETIGGGASTQALYQVLLKDSRFKETPVAAPGCIVISPTGYGSNLNYPHGHVGIVGDYGICSNDSSTGLWSENYNVPSWHEQFSTVEGYPVYYFQRI